MTEVTRMRWHAFQMLHPWQFIPAVCLMMPSSLCLVPYALFPEVSSKCFT